MHLIPFNISFNSFISTLGISISILMDKIKSDNKDYAYIYLE